MFTKMGKQYKGLRIVSWVLYPSGTNNRTVGVVTAQRKATKSREREKNLTSDENSLIKLRKTKSNTVSVKFVIEIEI